jgi:prepilin-type N-terminal cleavage/methylation domain-containing protein
MNKGSQSCATAAFSLLEMSVVLTIIALILGAVISLANRQFDTNKYQKTADTIKIIEAALQRQVMISGYLPCPAARNAAPATAIYGVATDCTAVAPAGTTDLSTIAGTADDVRVGVVPTRTLNLPDKVMMDAWNMRITYAVVKDLATTKITFDAYTKPASGGLALTDAAGNAMLAPTPTGNLVAYVVVSHGNDKKGATVAAGAAGSACTAGAVDSENCDNDAAFIDTTLLDSTSAGAAFYDDLVMWKPYYLIKPSLKY